MKNKTTAKLDRAAHMDLKGTGRWRGLNLKLPQEVAKLQIISRFVYYQAHSTLIGVRADENDRLLKAAIAHRRHRNQQAPIQVNGIIFHHPDNLTAELGRFNRMRQKR